MTMNLSVIIKNIAKLLKASKIAVHRRKTFVKLKSSRKNRVKMGFSL